MRIAQLRLRNFRNLDSCQLFPDPGINVIVGRNAQGKTNLLESIVLLSTTRSHRAVRDQDMIREHEPFCRAECHLDSSPPTVLTAVIHERGKTLMIQQHPVSRSTEFIGRLNAVLFAPSDLEVFEAPPKVRRRWMDVEIGKVSSRYMQLLSVYMKLLKERNSLLKREKTDPAMLEVLESQMIDHQVQIIGFRRHFIAEMTENLSRVYSGLSEEQAQISVRYRTLSEETDPQRLREQIKQKIIENRERDRILKTTGFGVHRDDLSFFLNDHDVVSYASQGQRRMVVLAWKLSLIDFIRKNQNEVPVLLLDDVLSELDRQKRINLFSFIPEEVQTWITATDIHEILDFLTRRPRLIEVSHGRIRPWKEDLSSVWNKR